MGTGSIRKRKKMSFKSLVNKLMKEPKSKTAATKIAGSVANAKMKGAGSGPTAKQKARAKSPATKKKPTAVIRDKDRVPDKSRSYTDKKGKKIEVKTFKYKSRYDSGVKDDPNELSKTRKSSRLSNTVELHKTKTKKDGTTKTKVKRAAGGGKKSQRLLTKFAKGKNKEGSSDVTTTRKSPTTMKSPAKKPLKGGQKSLPKELQEAILKSPGKMLTKSAIKMMDKSPMTMKAPMKKSKQKVEQDYARNAIADYKSGDKKAAKYEKKKALEVAAGESPAKMKKPKMKKKTTKSVASIGEKSYGKKVTTKGGNKTKTKEVYSEPGYSEIKKSKTKKDNVGYTSTKNSKKVIQREKPGKKAAKKMIRKGASTVFESSMGSAIMMKTNQSGGAYAAKNPAAPARQLKKLGSVISKHMKSGM
jgi:hypothetical protein